MLEKNTNTLGIIFPNTYDKLVPELAGDRLIASIPFAGRYRLIDFILSSMVNSGIDNISVLVRQRYHSLLDHLGSGRAWDLVRKNGGLNIFPPFAQDTINASEGRIVPLEGISVFLKDAKEKYVVISDANFAANFDFNDMIEKHIKSGADVTMAYTREAIPQALLDMEGISKGLYFTYEMDGDRVTKMNVNPKTQGTVNLGLPVYVLERELLIEKVNEAYVNGNIYFERDVLVPQAGSMNLQGYLFDGYVARITSVKSFFDESLKLLDDDNRDALFSPGQVFTKVRDDNPTRYISGAQASNVLVADGCVIEGIVEDSIIFRGVKIGKGAKVKNCVIMQDTVIGDGARLENVITDKKAQIGVAKELRGSETFPVFVAKGQKV